MTDLTEQQVFDRLKTSLREAMDCAARMGNGERGELYPKLRTELRVVEDYARLAGKYREDTRWFAFGVQVNEAAKRCGDWLRAKEPNWRFKGLSEILREAHAKASALETNKTGISGAILPVFGTAKEGKSMPNEYAGRSTKRKSGLIIPPGVTIQ